LADNNDSHIKHIAN